MDSVMKDESSASFFSIFEKKKRTFFFQPPDSDDSIRNFWTGPCKDTKKKKEMASTSPIFRLITPIDKN